MNKKEINNLIDPFDPIDPFDSIFEWLDCIRNFVQLPNIDLNLEKNRNEIVEMVENIIEEIEELY